MFNDDIQTKSDALLKEANTEAIEFACTEADVRELISRMKRDKEIKTIDPILFGGETCAFIVNYNEGWEIFSADKRLSPILAYSKTGSFNVEKTYNPGLLQWMDGVKQQTSKLRADRSIKANKNTEMWLGKTLALVSEPLLAKEAKSRDIEPLWTKVKLSDITVYEEGYLTYGPLLNTEWGQDEPWNLTLPVNNFYSLRFRQGCSPVAIGQVLYYLNSQTGAPSGLFHTITIDSWQSHIPFTGEPYYTFNMSKSDFNTNSPRWAQMIQTPDDYSESDSTSVQGARYVSDLLMDIGNRAGTTYLMCPRASGTENSGVISSLNSFGFSVDTLSSFNPSYVQSNIISGKPVIMGGRDTNFGRHMWVVDGISYSRYKTTTRYKWIMGYLEGTVPHGICATQEEAKAAAWAAGYDGPEDEMVTEEDTYSEPYPLYHMNWGWDGDHNGLYGNLGRIPEMGAVFQYNQIIFYNLTQNYAQVE